MSGPHRVIQPPGWDRPKGYANGILAAPGRALFLAGMVGWDGQGVFVPGGFLPQMDRALGNVLEVVRAAGGAPEHVTRLRIFVVDKREYLADLGEVGRIYRRHLGRHFPAMALVEVRALVEDAARIEIEADAVIPEPA